MPANVNPKINQAADIAARIAAAQADGSLRLEIGNKGDGHLERPSNGPWNPSFVQGGTTEQGPQQEQPVTGSFTGLVGDLMRGEMGMTQDQLDQINQETATAQLEKQKEQEKARGMDAKPEPIPESTPANVNPVTGEIIQPQTQTAPIGTAEQVTEEPKPEIGETNALPANEPSFDNQLTDEMLETMRNWPDADKTKYQGLVGQEGFTPVQAFRQVQFQRKAPSAPKESPYYKQKLPLSDEVVDDDIGLEDDDLEDESPQNDQWRSGRVGSDDDGSDDDGGDNEGDNSSDRRRWPSSSRDVPFTSGINTKNDKTFEDKEGHVRGWLSSNSFERTKDTINELFTRLGFRAKEGEKQDIGEYANTSEMWKNSIWAFERAIKMFFNPAIVKIEGDTIVTEKGNMSHIEHDADVQKSINSVMDFFKCSHADAIEMVICRGGVGVFTKKSRRGNEGFEYDMSIDEFVWLADGLLRSQDAESVQYANRSSSHPLSLVNVTDDVRDANRPKRGARGEWMKKDGSVYINGKRSYPLPILRPSLIQRLCEAKGGALYGQDPLDVLNSMLTEWKEFTYKNATAYNASLGTPDSFTDLLAYENICRAMLMANGVNPTDQGMQELRDKLTIEAIKGLAMASGDPAIQTAAQAEVERLGELTANAEAKIAKSSGKERRVWLDTLNAFFGGWNTIQNVMQAIHGVLLVMNPIEELYNTEEQKVITSHYRDGLVKQFKKMGKTDEEIDQILEDYTPTEQLSEAIRSKEAVKAIALASKLIRLTSVEFLVKYLEEGGELTVQGLRRAFAEYGVTDYSTVSPEALEKLGVDEKDKLGFLSFFRWLIDSDRWQSGAGLFQKAKADEFLRDALLEYSYANTAHTGIGLTASQMQEIATGENGGRRLVEAILQTTAGLEAYNTVGTNGLARKSFIDHMARSFLSKHGITSWAISNFIGRFIPFALQRVAKICPFSHAIGYATTLMINTLGLDQKMGINAFAYQLGGNMYKVEGGKLVHDHARAFRKCLLYDTIMARNKFVMALIFYAIIANFGGVQPPDDPRDLFNMSEWRIGTEEDSLPVKYAWFIDDFTGLALPLAMAMHIVASGTPLRENDTINDETLHGQDRLLVAGLVFENGLASWYDTGVLSDAVHFLAHPQQDFEAIFNPEVGSSFNPTFGQRLLALSKTAFWDALGDTAPAIIEEILPWSRDFVGLTSEDIAHSASYMYDEDDNVVPVEDYDTYMMRYNAQSNWVHAIIMNAIGAADGRNFYKQMPESTTNDPYASGTYDMFYLDLYDPDIPLDDQAAREEELANRADAVDQYILSHYQNPQQAVLDGFSLNYEARVNCIWHCYAEMDAIYDWYDQWLDLYHYDDQTYNMLIDARERELSKYEDLLYNYYRGGTIPWTIPEYYVLESDTAVRYVFPDGSPASYWSYLTGKAERETYRYGGKSTLLMPFTQPSTQHNPGYNYNTIPPYIMLDKDGNPINDTEAMFETAGEMGTIAHGRHTGETVQGLMWGQDYEGNFGVAPDGIPTTGDRSLKPREDSFSDVVNNIDGEAAAEILGLREPPTGRGTDPEDVSTSDADPESDGWGWGGYFVDENGNKIDPKDIEDFADLSKHATFVPTPPSGGSSYGYRNRGTSYGYRRYYRSPGSRYGGGSTNYAPKIYSSSEDVKGGYARGLNSPRPYRTTTTYLNPDFQTKGSREAYRRSDI